MKNLSCFKHPSYKGETGPDLSCKTCCTLFVSRIRAEQNSKFDEIKVKMSASFTALNDFKPAPTGTSTPSAQKFDSSWI